MPHKNVIRSFAPDSVYHSYNRGVEKRQIFMDEQDYGVFLARLKQMLIDPQNLSHAERLDHVKSYFGDIELVAYCLMPNHFHLLLYQKSERALAEFMRTLSTSYTMYFNIRYDRVGSLFQGTYKARRIVDEADWLHISRYIHLNPFAMEGEYIYYPYSSFQAYIVPEVRPKWLLPDRALAMFDSATDYASFVNSYASESQHEDIQQHYKLE